MNLKRLEIYQNGERVLEISFASQEMFDDLTFDNIPTVKRHLLTMVELIDPDQDGHPEVIDAKMIVPDYNEVSTDMIRMGYFLAIKDVMEKCVYLFDSDTEKIAALYKLRDDFNRSEKNKSKIDLKFIKI